jgi:hypothetical protein
MPAAPGQLGNDRYRELLTDRSVVYAAGTEDPLRVVVSNFRTIRRLAVDRGSLTSKQIVILLGRGYWRSLLRVAGDQCRFVPEPLEGITVYTIEKATSRTSNRGRSAGTYWKQQDYCSPRNRSISVA